MDAFLKDLRYAARMLVKSRGFTLVALLSLGLGIGANTAIFTFVNAVFLQSMPVEKPDELASIYVKENTSELFLRNSYLNYKDYRENTSSVFSGLTAFSGFGMSVNLSVEGRAEMAKAQMVAGNYFDVLGVKPILGRGFRPEEGEEIGTRRPVVVIGYKLWQQRFGGKPDALGKTLRINGHDLVIIGVTPKGFTGTNTLVPVEIWFPVAMRQQIAGEKFNAWFEARRLGMFEIVGRLRPGVSLKQAESQVQTFASELERRYPEDNKDLNARLRYTKDSTIDPDIRPNYIRGGFLLLAVAGAVLLIACANLANLLLVRAVARRREIAIRIALGASSGRMVRLLLCESLMLSLTGGAIGFLLAFWLRDFLWAMRPPAFPESMDISLDGQVLGFTLLLSVVTGLLFGLAPALQMRRPNLVPALKNEVPQLSGSLRRANAGNLLVVTQVAVSLLPLIGAGLFLRSLSNAQQFNPGFQIQNEAVLSFDLGTLGYDEATGKQFYRRVMERVETLPGVENVAMAESLKLYPFGYLMRTVFMEGQGRGAGEGEMVRTNNVTWTYFDTMRIPLVRGRAFTQADREGSTPVAVINETMAKRFWPGKDPVGGRFYFFGMEQPTEVIGIVRDTKYQSLLEEEKPYIYVPLEQVYSTPVYLHVRTSGNPEATLQAMRKEVQALDPNLGLGTAWTMAQVFERNLWAPRLGATLLTAFGALALCLAGIGIYGVMAYSANQRRREIGIRMSLGARKIDVLRLMLQDGMVLVTIGLGLGLFAAAAMGKSLSGYLFGLSGTDVGMFTAGTLILALAALIANYIAARRSTQVNPVDVLKS